MKMRIEGPIRLERKGDVLPSEQIKDLLKEKAKDIKLEIPFAADGFKSTKTPLQPDGKTPIKVASANLTIKKVEKPVKKKKGGK